MQGMNFIFESFRINANEEISFLENLLEVSKFGFLLLLITLIRPNAPQLNSLVLFAYDFWLFNYAECQ